MKLLNQKCLYKEITKCKKDYSFVLAIKTFVVRLNFLINTV